MSEARSSEDRTMKKVLLILLALLGAVVIVGGFVVLAVAAVAVSAKGRVPRTTILEVDLEQPIIEYAEEDPFSKILHGTTLTTRDVVDALQVAAADDRVVGLVARVGAAPMGLAQIQEIRDAVIAFRESGKPAVAWGETFGEVGPGNGAYYLATAFDTIYLQPSGDIGLTGLIYESPFVHGTLEKLGIKPEMDHRHEYKNAMNLFTEEEFTAAHREAMQVLMSSQFDQIVEGIAEGRDLDDQEVRTLIDRGPFLGREAVDAGLVDDLLYRDQVYDRARETAGPNSSFLFLSKYAARSGGANRRGPTIALIYGVGAVTRGPSAYDPLFGSNSMGSDTVSGAFRDAIEDDDVRAIVFRVDSPGGSYVASDAIWRETVRAKEAGKPVIVTMGNLAASGGYFVSMWADKIVAQPGTITASIGVLGGKMVTDGFWNKIGLTWDEVHSSTNATMWTSLAPYSPEEWSRFQAWLDRVYEDFTSKVAEGRGMTKERILEIAKGRVWTGSDALEIGLVDELGGFPAAFRLAREAAGLEPDADIRVRLYPRPRSAFERLFDDSAESSEPSAEAALLVRGLEVARPAARLARQLGILGEPMGPLSVEIQPAQ
jgi:protease-4